MVAGVWISMDKLDIHFPGTTKNNCSEASLLRLLPYSQVCMYMIEGVVGNEGWSEVRNGEAGGRTEARNVVHDHEGMKMDEFKI
ncbi:hypothetical protein L6452_05840 [Arctium lappa]|uniref:Uncharacterized protein n=1 Tax=Arctium lappa TaxID=4217 RepID=A0ACB9EHK2_ARCLA|nr:hypothetical protein L6452_05840 [Arctium lappa]